MKIPEQIIALIIVLCLNIKNSTQSHFRGGSISAKPLSYTNNTVTYEFLLSLSWTQANPNFCNQTSVNSGNLIGDSGGLKCKKIGTQACNYILADTRTPCKYFSPFEVDNWSYGEQTFTYTLPTTDIYEASYTGSAWIGLVGGGSSWEVRVRLDTRLRPDTRKINTSPITKIQPLIKVRKGIKTNITIVTSDADFTDDIRCRWATSVQEECAGICQSVPQATLDSRKCIVTFDGTLAASVVGYYALAIQVEDFKTKTDTVALSSVPLQFLVQVVNLASTCNTPPQFLGEIQDSSCYAVQIGSKFFDMIMAESQCQGQTITNIVVIGLAGSVLSPLTSTSVSTRKYVNMTWTPQQSQYGPNVICASATDSVLLVSFKCYTVLAGFTAPSPIKNTGTPTNLIQSNSLKVEWSIRFDQSIERADRSAFINFYSQNGMLVLKIDAFLQASVRVANSTLYFETNHNFGVGSYYILLDYGVVRGTAECKLASNHLVDNKFWTFEVKQPTTTPTTTTTTTTTTTPTTTPSTTTTTTTAPITTTVMGTTEIETDIAQQKNTNNIGSILGGIFGAIGALLVIALLIIVVFKKKKENEEKNKVVPNDENLDL